VRPGREHGPESSPLTIAMPPSPRGCGVRPRRERSRVVKIDDCDATITVRCEAGEGARSRVVTIDDCDTCEAEEGVRSRVVTIDDCDATITARLRCEAEEGTRSRVVTIDDCDATITAQLW